MKGFLYGQSGFNLLENSIKIDEYVKLAKESGFDFLSITDKNMYASYKFYNLCKDNNIKPVIGYEYEYIETDGIKSTILLYAKNKKGLKDIFDISSKKNLNEDINLNDILNDDDIICIFSFDNSYLYRLFKKGLYQNLSEYLNNIKNDNTFIGYSLTNNLRNIQITNDFMDYIFDSGIKLIPLHNTKYLLKDDLIVYKALCDMNQHKFNVSDEEDYSFLENPSDDPYLDELIDNIDDELFTHVEKTIPKYPNTKGYDSAIFLKNLAHKGLEKRKRYDKKHVERLNYELGIISKMGYDDYFLIVWDFIKYAKKSDILVGPGRGSAAGSLCAYSLGITEIDPLDYDLLFERFLNPERVSMPDIDTDFPDDKRDQVIDYVKNFYGKNHVCNITAFGTFQIKSSMRELSKCFNIELSRAEALISMVEKRGYDDLIKEYEDTELKDFLFIAKRLENLPKHISTHAAGIIISNDDLFETIPLQEGINGLYQSQFEYADLESLGLLKMDFLGIKNLSMLKAMMDMVVGFDQDKLRHIPLDDYNVYKLFQNADTLGIFQFESPGIKRVLRDIKPTKFEDLVAINALYRPGPMENIGEFSLRKKGARFEYLHPDLKPILEETYGIIVYQEQVMRIAQKFAGFSLGESDILRKAISKKNAQVLDKLKNKFIEGSIKLGYDEKLAIEIYNLIYKFANYGFNKSHSVVYALLAYQMAYFKVNYFISFISNVLNNTIGNHKEMEEYIKYAKLHNVKILAPDINKSYHIFTYQDGVIYMPFTAIKSIGIALSNEILRNRGEKGPFKSYEDFKNRCSIPSSSLEALIFAGAFSSFGKTKKSLVKSMTAKEDIFFKHMDNVIIDDEEPILSGQAFITTSITRINDGTGLYLVSFNSFEDFPTIGSQNRIYLAADTNLLYRFDSQGIYLPIMNWQGSKGEKYEKENY